MTVARVAYRTCPLCEAGCGLEISLDADDKVMRIRGDRDDVFSHGYICPKGSTLKQLHEDPDRLRQPLAKVDGRHVPVSWDEAWALIADGFRRVIEAHGRRSIGIYRGNPGAHSLGLMAFNRVLGQAIGSYQRFSASTVDQVPKHVAAGYMFGHPSSIPVPDLDRTDHLVMLGANPLESNGSLCTAPDFPGRLEAIRARGGKVVVVDPRRTRTAEAADEWVSVRPGTDGLLVAAMLNVVLSEGLARTDLHLGGLVDGLDELADALAGFTPEAVSEATGVDAADITRLARDFATARTAAMYGRIGVNAVSFGSTTAWLIDAMNVVTGNLDRPGGAMFSSPATVAATTRSNGDSRGFAIGKGHSRVRGFPEVMGEYPAATMAEEILVPGDGQIRAMITVAGNPIISTPNDGALDRAFASLDFMVSIDIYLNETTRYADVILPSPSQLQKDHYDLALLGFAVRNVANYSPPVIPLDEGQPDEWEVLAKLAAVIQTLDPEAPADVVDDLTIESLVQRGVRTPGSAVHGRDPDEILDVLASSGRRGPARILDFMLQTGQYGAGFGADPEGLSLDVLLDNPHGVDLGALQPRLPDLLRTPTGRIDLAPAQLVADLERLRNSIDEPRGTLLLVGRRHLKSNNSWMHNLNVLTKGSLDCTLQMNPADARRLGLEAVDSVVVTSGVGEVTVSLEITDSVRTGVVSLPHGWGHDVEGVQLDVARRKPGVNSNVLSSNEHLDPLSGNAVLNAIPVTVRSA